MPIFLEVLSEYSQLTIGLYFHHVMHDMSYYAWHTMLMFFQVMLIVLLITHFLSTGSTLCAEGSSHCSILSSYTTCSFSNNKNNQFHVIVNTFSNYMQNIWNKFIKFVQTTISTILLCKKMQTGMRKNLFKKLSTNAKNTNNLLMSNAMHFYIPTSVWCITQQQSG